MTGTIAVTGASGFVGAAAAAALARAGWNVRALIHSRPLPDDLLQLGVTPVKGSLDDAASLDALCGGAEAVVHCAALIKARRKADFSDANVAGARGVFAAADRAGARLLFMSSLAAREPQLSVYARSKADAESALAGLGAETGLRWDVLRPPAVYGPGDPETLKLLRAMGGGVAPVPDVPGARVAMIHVADLAGAVRAWADSRETSQSVYEIDDGCEAGRGWDEIVAAASEALGRRGRRIGLPPRLLIAGAGVYEGAARLFRRTPMVTADKLRELCWPDWRCSSAAFARRYDWTPGRDLRTGLRETVDWYRKAGWL